MRWQWHRNETWYLNVEDMVGLSVGRRPHCRAWLMIATRNSVNVPKIITTTSGLWSTIDYCNCNRTGVPGITPFSPWFVVNQSKTTAKSRFNGICTAKSHFTEFIDQVFLNASRSNWRSGKLQRQFIESLTYQTSFKDSLNPSSDVNRSNISGRKGNNTDTSVRYLLQGRSMVSRLRRFCRWLGWYDAAIWIRKYEIYLTNRILDTN